MPGERKQATVLFADIAGSTARIAGMDAEGAMNFLHPIVTIMARAVHRFDGTVLRTLGDGLKAAFGVPHAREGHAVLACHAALAMRAAVAALPDAPMIRIGLHSGEVVSGKLYTGSTIEQDATGLTVHLASRIEQEAPPGEICLSRASQTLLGAYCDTEPLGARALKGIPDPIEIFRLVGLKPAVNSEHFRGAPLLPLRGRALELETLQHALLDTAPGSPRVIGVSGPPGVGKSRLCFEFGEWCRKRQIKVLEARAQVHSRATPLVPVLEALRAFFRIEPDTDAETARTRIEQTLTMLALPVVEHLAPLADFLGCAEATSRVIDPTTRRMRLRDSIGRIVKAAWSQTSVIIIEDLHWLDEASLDFLETWMAAVEGTRVLMVLTFRPDWSPPSRPAWYRELALPELGLGEVGQVICDLIGDGAGLDQVVAHVAERSDGNPFFAEELILSLAQSGVLVGERGRYTLAPSGWQNPTLPTTVEAVIGARIDLLPESEKALLQTGAIIGKEFPFEVVRSGHRPVRCGRPAVAEAASRGRTDPAARNRDGRKLRVSSSVDSGGCLRDATAVHAHGPACRRGAGDRGAGVGTGRRVRRPVGASLRGRGEYGCRGHAFAAFGALGWADQLGTRAGGLEKDPRHDAGSAAVKGKR